jgi:membrane-associated protein
MITATSLSFLFFIVFPASFAIPTGALFFVVSLAALSETASGIFLIILITFLAAVLGDIATYLVARKYNKKIHSIICKNKFLKKQERKADKVFQKYGIASLFLSRFFLQGVGPFLNYYAGMKKLKIKNFIIPIIFGEIIYTGIYVSIGVIFRETWQDLLKFLADFSILIALILLVIIVIVKLKKLHK